MIEKTLNVATSCRFAFDATEYTRSEPFDPGACGAQPHRNWHVHRFRIPQPLTNLYDVT
jgi:hypothetical protein